MNDTNDQQHDPISDGLSSAADRIDVGNADAMLTSVHGVAAARRRRRTAVLGVAAAGTLAVSGVVLANVVSDDGSTDTILSADSVPPTTEVADDVDAAPPTAVPVVPDIVPGASGDAVPVQVVPTDSMSTTDPAVASDASYANVPQLYAWQDGFLAVYRDAEPQALPAELPPEIAEQFSQEVRDFFADGLPPTVDEAMAQLDEAGLLDEVTDVVTSNPDVYDAIYGTPSEVTVSVRFSTDGVEWSDVDANFPDELSQSYNTYVVGERFVIVSDDRERALDGSPPAGGGEITVLSSTNLVDWTRQAIPIPDRPADLPDFVRVDTYPDDLVANADRWVLRISTYSEVDVISLLDEDLQDRVRSGNGGYGTSTDDEGVTLEIYEPQPQELDGDESVDTVDVMPDEPTERIRFTWAELGLDAAPDDLNEQSTETWTSDWVDAPVVSPSDAGGDGGWYRTAAVDAGFVAATDQDISFSVDGLTWSSVDLPVDGFVDNLMPVGDDVIAFVNGVDGSASQHRLDLSTMTWTTIVIDGLPDGFSVDRSVNGAATLYEHENGEFGGGPSTSVGTAEVDGFLVELTTTFSIGSAEIGYTVTDLASGEIVSTETSDDIDAAESPFEFAEESYELEGGEGVIFLDPATGERLIEVPFEDMTFVTLDADGEPIPERDFSDAPPSIPGRWMLATNGDSWIVEQLTEASSADSQDDYLASEFGDVAVNGDTVLISKFDGTFLRYDLG